MNIFEPNASTPFVLYLSKEGDSIKIEETARQDHLFERSNLQKEASACKTHEEVLKFLKKERKNPNLQFFHRDNPAYDRHSGAFTPLKIHQCSIDILISFVKYKIKEQEHGVRDTSICASCVLL